MSRGSGAARGRQAVTMRPICRSSVTLTISSQLGRRLARRPLLLGLQTSPMRTTKVVKNTPLIGAILTAFFT